MAEPYVGEIRMFAGAYAPAGWAFCQGQSLSINQNELLFMLIGTTYGGDSGTVFNLPDLRGRLPVGQGQFPEGEMYDLAKQGGVEQVTLTENHLPVHRHGAQANSARGDFASPAGRFWAGGSEPNYAAVTAGRPVPMSQAAMRSVGGGQAHDNMMPYLPISFIIALHGIWPSQA